MSVFLPHSWPNNSTKLFYFVRFTNRVSNRVYSPGIDRRQHYNYDDEDYNYYYQYYYNVSFERPPSYRSYNRKKI